MKVTYDKPTADSDCKSRCIRMLFEAYSRVGIHEPLDALRIRGHWNEAHTLRDVFSGYDYDLQSWLTVDMGIQP